ncbi:hypothetical protein [Nitrosopumilus sp.]|uniref:hypothetical protein n=1 Tax=Nitrosopumilus sp. TaxID=2024843 RepID=UPI003D14EA45
MALVEKSISGKIAQDFHRTGYDEADTLTTSWANKVVIKNKDFRNLGFTIRIDGGAIDGDYRVYGTYKPNADTDVSGDEWQEETASTALTRDVNVSAVITKPYDTIIIQAKADSDTPAFKYWYRGMN